jgi:hypothetical protein
MIAIEKCSGDRANVTAMLKSGEARKILLEN